MVTNLLRRYAEHAENADYREKLEHLFTTQTCPDCAGHAPAPRKPRRDGGRANRSSDHRQLPLQRAGTPGWRACRRSSASEEMLIAEPILDDLHERIGRLVEVGVGYLTLERASPTLSAGEAQRLRLAALLGSGLTGVLYVLDEPTIGLHPRDTPRLIDVLRRLRDLGNTVLVIEHDLEMIRAADYLVDFGPGAGKHGGQIVAAGTPDGSGRSRPARSPAPTWPGG